MAAVVSILNHAFQWVWLVLSLARGGGVRHHSYHQDQHGDAAIILQQLYVESSDMENVY